MLKEANDQALAAELDEDSKQQDEDMRMAEHEAEEAEAAATKKRSAEEAFERDCESLAVSISDPEFIKHVASADTADADRTAAIRKMVAEKFRATPHG